MFGRCEVYKREAITNTTIGRCAWRSSEKVGVCVQLMRSPVILAPCQVMKVLAGYRFMGGVLSHKL